MDINVRNKIVYLAQIFMFSMYVELAVRNIVLGTNDRMGIFYILAALTAAVIIFSIIKSLMSFIDICMYAMLFSGCCYTAVKCSNTFIYLAALFLTIILYFLFIRCKLKNIGYFVSPAGIFRIRMFILKILHFTFVFSVLFMGLESVTVFSITQSVLTVIFVYLMRCIIYRDIRNIVIVGAILELAVIVCMILIMPWNYSVNIVAYQIENTIYVYINRFLCALLLSLLEIPFNPVWSFEKNLKG